ncbi:FAS1-like dehydratase domain-containing protein [Aquipuribacter sp. SD81]|uniref:FAS1-like dehydratase domain-containing protein n=1 Tax=Aquipuribacter sp. SD81 TaxID=3127703 RepID=UPI003019FB60
MTLDQGLVGREYPADEPFVVGREAVRAFARAVGATHPWHHDVGAARAAGFADLVAPPTFLVVAAQGATQRLVADPEVGIEYARVVHGEQGFEHHAPVVAGEELLVTTTVAALRQAAGVDMLTLRTEVTTVAGEARSTVTAMLVHRGAAA